MGALPAISAGVSVIGGIANMSAKSKAAAAQREQLQAQSYQQAQQQVSSEAILASQQQLAQTQYQQGILAQMMQFQQTDMGLQAQKALQAFKAQQDAYALQAGELQGAAELGGQAEQLKRQGAQVAINADQQRGASDAQVADLAQQGAGELRNIDAQLTAEQRKRLSLESSGRLASSGSDASQRRQMLDRIAMSLSAGLEMDNVQVKRALQAMGEQDLADIGERLGLMDNASSVESVATNLKLLRGNTALQLGAAQQNNVATQGSLDFARQNNLVNSTLNAQSTTDAYAAQNYALGVQRSTGANTAASLAQSNATMQSNVKGNSLLDYLNMGVNTYGAVSPLLNRTPTTSPTSTLYSGFPTVNSNVG